MAIDHIVLYRTKDTVPGDNPLGMRFHADDSNHAEEQFLDAEPDAEVIWIFEGSDYQSALDEFWNNLEGCSHAC
jgi:hypothetical protein